MASRCLVSGARITTGPRLIAFVVMLGLLLASTSNVVAQSETWSPPVTVYFPQTGHTLDRLFLDLWRERGGASTFGYPVTPEMTEENGHIVQYLHYARFEYWPEGGPDGELVQLGSIGYELQPGGSEVQGLNEVRTGSERDDDTIARAWRPLDEKSAARQNTATWRFVPETRHSVQHGFKTFWEATGEASYLGNPLTEEYILAGVTYQVFERGQLAWQQGRDPWLVPLGEVLARQKRLDMSPHPQGSVPTYDESLFIPPPPRMGSGVDAPPPPAGYDKVILVSLSQQTLWAYEAGALVGSTLVSTGRPGFETPTGTFQIVVKKKVEDMKGLLGGEYYDIKDVPDVMYFTAVGHAIHGAFWHNNFGQVMSHGCINLPLDAASWLYDWTPMGTAVVIVA